MKNCFFESYGIQIMAPFYLEHPALLLRMSNAMTLWTHDNNDEKCKSFWLEILNEWIESVFLQCSIISSRHRSHKHLNEFFTDATDATATVCHTFLCRVFCDLLLWWMWNNEKAEKENNNTQKLNRYVNHFTGINKFSSYVQKQL